MSPSAPLAAIGAYYFDGWAGRSAHAGDPNEPWAANAPMQLTRRMLEEFPEREPAWGWRDDSQATMEQQIDLAADAGLAYFAFCWYWHDDGGPANARAIAADPLNTSLRLYLQAANMPRMRFCLLVANHQGFDIRGAPAWRQAADLWLPYLLHPQCVTADGKPLLVIFNPAGADREGLAYLQQAAHSAGLPGVSVAGCGRGEPEDGFTHRTHYTIISGYTGGSEEHTYAELAAANQSAWAGRPGQPYIPIITAGWDKRPWEGPAGLNQQPGWYYPDRTPDQFADFVRSALAWMEAHPEQITAERLALIYAWNEFGEGGYIAPTKGDPDGAYLQSLRALLLPGS